MNAASLTHNLDAGKRWGTAAERYEAFSAHFADAIALCVERAAVSPGERVLDIATGTGWAARLLAAAGGNVIGIDFAEPLIAAARRLAVEAGYEVDFRVGDAEALAFDDASFDVVVSSFGVIFAGDHERAAAEIKRVCKPGGRLVMTAWDADGVVGRLTREVWAKHGPKPTGNPPRSMLAWGNLEYARSLLGDAFELSGERAVSVLSAPSGEAVWDLWARSNGTMIDLLSRKTPEQRQDFRADFIAFHERFRQGEGIVMPREYLLFAGRRNVPR